MGGKMRDSIRRRAIRLLIGLLALAATQVFHHYVGAGILELLIDKSLQYRRGEVWGFFWFLLAFILRLGPLAAIVIWYFLRPSKSE